MCSNPKNQPKDGQDAAPKLKEESATGDVGVSSNNSTVKEEGPNSKKGDQQIDTTSSSSLSIRHRRKRESYSSYVAETGGPRTTTTTTKSQFVRKKPKKQSKAKQKHGADGPSGGLEALVPSLIGLAIFGCAIMAKMGFRGRAEVAGIDLGTTNSVICVQQPSKGVGIIDCIQDPATNSPIIPSVVSFLEPSERPVGAKSKTPSLLNPHPSQVVVGSAAKKRIDSHPHHTLYNAKRVLGRHPTDRAIEELQEEVEFQIHIQEEKVEKEEEDDDDEIEIAPDQRVVFRVPHHSSSNAPSEWMSIAPQQVGSYIVNALIQFTNEQLGHDNVKAAVICVPAKFDTLQRQRTVAAFQQAGVKVTRIIEEPTAAALAYGLHQKAGVDYIVVYDFGGGTLDISLLHVSEGFVDVMGSDGDDRLGGADFDAAIAHHWLEQQEPEEEDGNSSSSSNPTTNHKTMVEAVASVLKQLEVVLEDTPQHMDLEQELSLHCPVILENPLCTVSSFHTLGEQMKIRLSNTYQETQDEEAEQDEAPLETQCLRLPDGMTSIPLQKNDPLSMVDTFCKSLSKTTLTLSRKEFQKLAQPLLERSIVPVQRLLKDLNLKTSEIDEVVMVGGTTRMPQIRSLVRQALSDSQLNTHIDPDITVAYGAASVID